jgi:hypothetical protein
VRWSVWQKKLSLGSKKFANHASFSEQPPMGPQTIWMREIGNAPHQGSQMAHQWLYHGHDFPQHSHPRLFPSTKVKSCRPSPPRAYVSWKMVACFSDTLGSS